MARASKVTEAVAASTKKEYYATEVKSRKPLCFLIQRYLNVKIAECFS